MYILILEILLFTFLFTFVREFQDFMMLPLYLFHMPLLLLRLLILLLQYWLLLYKKKPTHAFYGGLVHRSLKVNKGIHKEEGRGMKIKMSEHDHVCVQNKTIYPSQDAYIRHIM